MTPLSHQWLSTGILFLLLLAVSCSDQKAAVTVEETPSTRRAGAEPPERICALDLTPTMKNQATEILVGLWKKETEDQTIVRFKLPDKNDLEVLSLEVRLAEIAGSERERAAYVYAECRDKHGMRKAISSEVGRFTYLGKTEYALGWCTKTTVMSAGRCNIQSIGKYDGSDFKTGTEHNRMILYFEVK